MVESLSKPINERARSKKSAKKAIVVSTSDDVTEENKNSLNRALQPSEQPSASNMITAYPK